MIINWELPNDYSLMNKSKDVESDNIKISFTLPPNEGKMSIITDLSKNLQSKDIRISMVYIFHFFKDEDQISETPIITRQFDRQTPRSQQSLAVNFNDVFKNNQNKSRYRIQIEIKTITTKEIRNNSNSPFKSPLFSSPRSTKRQTPILEELPNQNLPSENPKFNQNLHGQNEDHNDQNKTISSSSFYSKAATQHIEKACSTPPLEYYQTKPKEPKGTLFRPTRLISRKQSKESHSTNPFFPSEKVNHDEFKSKENESSEKFKLKEKNSRQNEFQLTEVDSPDILIKPKSGLSQSKENAIEQSLKSKEKQMKENRLNLTLENDNQQNKIEEFFTTTENKDKVNSPLKVNSFAQKMIKDNLFKKHENKEIKVTPLMESSLSSRISSCSQPLTIKPNDLVTKPHFSHQSEPEKVPYRGISNQGATCYMNSMLQALFHLPAFRRLIYMVDPSISNENEEKNIQYQLQKLFASLQLSTGNACSTRGLTKSFGWSDIDAFMQHDVQEFCRVILDNLETKIDKQPELKGSIQNLFRGQIRSYIRCAKVPYKSERDEYFYDLSLNVKGCSDLNQSFAKYIEREKLFGKNQYDTGDPRYGKQDAIMGNEFVEFPPILHLHLRRFEFNGYQMSKINSRFEFPFEIDLGQYMSQDAKNRSKQVYQLFGVLVHIGSAQSGHYYAYLRPNPDNNWYEFNDSSVTHSTEKDAIENNFGGSAEPKSQIRHLLRPFNHILKLESQRCFSAYMLEYVRKCDIPRIFKPVTPDEIPEEVRKNVIEHEEMKRRKKEEERIRLNTLKFHIFNSHNIQQYIANENRLSMPSAYSQNYSTEVTGIRGDQYSTIFKKIEDVFNGPFELYEMKPDLGILSKPLMSNDTIYSGMNLYVYPDVNLQETDPTTNIIIFIFAYISEFTKPLQLISVKKFNQNSPVTDVFDEIESKNMHPNRIYKRLSPSSVSLIERAEESFKSNAIESGAFLIVEIENDSIPEFLIQRNHKDKIEKENKSKESQIEVVKYLDLYKPETLLEFFDILSNTVVMLIITTNSTVTSINHTEYRISFPKTRNFFAFFNFLRFIFNIPEMRTVSLYKDSSRTPLIVSEDQNVSEILANNKPLPRFFLFSFDQLSETVFYHSLLIKYKIVGSFVSLTDSNFNLWVHENATIADLIHSAELHVRNLHTIYSRTNETNETNEIKKRTLLSQKFFFQIYSIKNHQHCIYSPDQLISEISEDFLIEIDVEFPHIVDVFNSFILPEINRSGESIEPLQDIKQLPEFAWVLFQIEKDAMNQICNIDKKSSCLLRVFKGDTLTSIKTRVATMLNRDSNYFFKMESNWFTFSISIFENFYRKTVQKLNNSDSIYPLIKGDSPQINLKLMMLPSININQ